MTSAFSVRRLTRGAGLKPCSESGKGEVHGHLQSKVSFLRREKGDQVSCCNWLQVGSRKGSQPAFPHL
jgi:hypothetical protein